MGWGGGESSVEGGEVILLRRKDKVHVHTLAESAGAVLEQRVLPNAAEMCFGDVVLSSANNQVRM